jgi:hypothetical protein
MRHGVLPPIRRSCFASPRQHAPRRSAQGKAWKTQLNQQPTSRMTRSKSQTIPNSADAADDDGSLSAPSRVPSSSSSSSSSANSGEVPAPAAAAQGYGEKSQLQQPSLEKPSGSRSHEQRKSSSTDGPFVATRTRTRGGIVDDSSSQAAACSDAPGRASEDKSHLEPMSEDEVCDWTIHPVELKSELDETTAQRLGPYRLNYTRWMLKSRKWQKTDVVFTKRARADGISLKFICLSDSMRRGEPGEV